MEELETLERFECPECPGPPPEFRLPPPPRPPFLTEGTFCPETIPDLEDCGAFPMIDPSYHTNPSLQSTALIITCAVVLLLMAAIVSVVFWKHKRKVQNLLPCKSAAGAAAAAASAGRARIIADGQPLGGSGNAIPYEDLPGSGGLPQLRNHLTSHPSVQQPTIEMLEAKEGGRRRGGVFVCSSPGPDPYASQDLYNPVYEELSTGDHGETDEESELNARNRLHRHQHYHRNRNQRHRGTTATSKPVSEDEFAEDELSIGEPSETRMLSSSTGSAGWGTCPSAACGSFRERREKSPRSLDRRRRDNKTRDVGEFHEGMLRDALLQLYPSVAAVAGVRTITSQREKSVPSVAQILPYFVASMPVNRSHNREDNPYESVPVLGPLQHYSSQNRSNNREKCCRKWSTERYGKYPPCATSEYRRERENPTPIYTQVGGSSEYSDAYSQPSDVLCNEESYAQPLYRTTRDPERISSGLYQGQQRQQQQQQQPDSSFGSDSGYSHHTSGTTGTNDTNRNDYRKDNHQNSHHSHRSVEYIVS